MKFSFNWLQSFFKTKLPKPNILADVLTMHFAEVESVERKGNDFILDIDIRPNRAGDCLSHIGVAREVGAILGLKRNHPEIALIKDIKDRKVKVKDLLSLDVKVKDCYCRRYTARIMTGVEVGSSPEWVKDRLESCGLRPINNIVDAANYVMLETGQPLHAFDAAKLSDHKISVRFSGDGEKIKTLDNQEFSLNHNVLVIADSETALAIAGIKGGKKAEIDENTKDIIIESANFDSRAVRFASRFLNLRTDASVRFEHGVDPNLTESALNRATDLIQDIAGGKIIFGIADHYPQKIGEKKINLDMDKLQRLLGIRIAQEKAKKILESLEFKIETKTTKFLEVKVPTFRQDVNLQEDLIEEVGRVFGYDKIPAVFPLASIIPPPRNNDIFWEDFVKNTLKEAGFSEVYNYSFFGKKEAELFNKEDLIEVENPLSKEQQYLRRSLIPNILKDIAKNQESFKTISLFEIGKVFSQGKEPQEKRMMTIARTGEDFAFMKGILETILHRMGISDIWYDNFQMIPDESSDKIWNCDKSAEVKIGNEKIGFVGQVNPKVLSDFEIKGQASLLDIDFDKLIKLAWEEFEYQPLPKFPAAVIDIAVLVPGEVMIEDVTNKISAVGGTILRDIDLFDVYDGRGLPTGKKSLAFHVILQAKDHTLSSGEISDAQSKIIKALEGDPEWQVRK